MATFWAVSILAFLVNVINGQKLMVGLGLKDDGILDSVEVLNLGGDKTCTAPDYPFRVYGSIGAMGVDGNPMICGGSGDGPSVYEDRCYSLVNGNWENTLNMTEQRAYAAVVSLDGKLIVTGGGNSGVGLEGISNTGETLTSSDGWKKSLPELPIRTYFHCSVKVNETAIMVIGGATDNYNSSQTYIYNAGDEDWTPGPALKYGRHHHACAGINVDDKYSIIVAGGVNGSAMTSTEILEEGSNAWTTGPDLPFGIYRSVMVELENSTVLVGGQTQDVNFLNSLYELAPGNDGKLAWTRMDETLETARSFHTAFLVDDCVENESLEEEGTRATEANSDEDDDDETTTSSSDAN